MGTGGLSSWG